MRHTYTVCTVLCGALSLLTAHAAPPRAEDYFRPPAIRSAQVSPSGQRLALLVSTDRGGTAIEVMDLPPDSKRPRRIVAQYDDADISRVAWVNDGRLVYRATDLSRGADVRAGRSGTFAIDHDGQNERALTAWARKVSTTGTTIASRTLSWEWGWRNAIDDGSDDIVVHKFIREGVRRGDWSTRGTARLNTKDLTLTPLQASMPEHTQVWLSEVDQIPIVAQSYNQGRAKLYWRRTPKADWTLLQDEDYLRGSAYTPLALEQSRMIVSTQGDGGTEVLYAVDLPSGKRAADPMMAVKGLTYEATQGRRSFHRVTTRDGLEIPVYVTHLCDTSGGCNR